MHPGFSIIFFTTATGAGYGLLFAMALFAAIGVLPSGVGFSLTGFALAFALITAGLVSSTFHLGHPERAWRALSQWRSSWLSREGIAAVATYPVAGSFVLDWLFRGWGAGTDELLPILALATALMCVVTVVCTGMIYASLKPIRRWCNGWVMPIYLALALMTGALWLNALTLTFGESRPALAGLAAAATVLACLLKLGYWRFIDGDQGGPTAETATGLGALGQVRLFEAPHTSENFLQKEMGYQIARKHAAELRRVTIWGGFAAPLLFTLAAVGLGGGWTAAVLTLLAAALASAGVVVERWLFFAEAKHTVTLYYGAAAV